MLRNFVKSAIIADQEDMSYAKALEMSFGTGEDGRHRMDFQRIANNSEFWGDGFFPVMLGELITDPLLVLGNFSQGRVCALATDVAPHWATGLVDWGDARIKAHATYASPVEVGNWYVEFFANILKWTASCL